jgi:hypothetical protein
MIKLQKLIQLNIKYNVLLQDIKTLLRNTLEEGGYTKDNPFKESVGKRYLPKFNISTEYGIFEYDINSIYLDDSGNICIISINSYDGEVQLDINDLEYKDLESLLQCLN